MNEEIIVIVSFELLIRLVVANKTDRRACYDDDVL